MNTRERLKSYLKYLKISEDEFQKRANLSNGYVSNLGESPRRVSLEKIRMSFPDLNINWLKTGIGEMVNNNDSDMLCEPIIKSNIGIPYYNVDFEMGFDLMINDQTCNPEFLINYLPYNRKATCWCNATGLSMSPTIESGDIIALKEINDFSVLLNDKIYAIVTTNDLRTIKRVEDKGDTIILNPDNKDYNPQTISKDKLSKVFLVVGSIKKF